MRIKTTRANTTQTTGSTQAKYALASPAVWLHVSGKAGAGNFRFIGIFIKEILQYTSEYKDDKAHSCCTVL